MNIAYQAFGDGPFDLVFVPGPKAALAGLGIEPVADLPGVGAGLADHPVTRLLLVPKAGSCDPQTPLAQVVLRYTAPGSGEFNDMQHSSWPAPHQSAAATPTADRVPATPTAPPPCQER